MKVDNSIITRLRDACNKSRIEVEQQAGLSYRSLERIELSQVTASSPTLTCLEHFFSGKFTYVLTFTPNEQEDIHDK